MPKKDNNLQEGYSEGAEFRFLGNLFGALMASAGLLAGTMMHERDLDYWLEDIVPLLLLLFTLRGLIKSSMELAKDSMYYEEQKKHVLEALAKQEQMAAAASEGTNAGIPKIASKPHYTEDEVIDAVSKRIEQQRDEATKKNKLVN
jgi:hypothetical protein